MRSIHVAWAVLCAVICVASFWVGEQCEELRHVADTAKLTSSIVARESLAWTDGFNNGVQCGLIAYTYAPEGDPSREDVPVMTLRARYWYIALKQMRQYQNSKRPTSNAQRPTPNEIP